VLLLLPAGGVLGGGVEGGGVVRGVGAEDGSLTAYRSSSSKYSCRIGRGGQQQCSNPKEEQNCQQRHYT
jgi:hypothetical protein